MYVVFSYCVCNLLFVNNCFRVLFGVKELVKFWVCCFFIIFGVKEMVILVCVENWISVVLSELVGMDSVIVWGVLSCFGGVFG